MRNTASLTWPFTHDVTVPPTINYWFSVDPAFEVYFGLNYLHAMKCNPPTTKPM